MPDQPGILRHNIATVILLHKGNFMEDVILMSQMFSFSKGFFTSNQELRSTEVEPAGRK